SRLRMRPNRSDDVALAASFQSKAAGGRKPRRLQSNASRAVAHTMTKVMAKTAKKTEALAAVGGQKTREKPHAQNHNASTRQARNSPSRIRKTAPTMPTTISPARTLRRPGAFCSGPVIPIVIVGLYQSKSCGGAYRPGRHPFFAATFLH